MSKENSFDGRGKSHLRCLFGRKAFVTLGLESGTHILPIFTAAIALGPCFKTNRVFEKMASRTFVCEVTVY